MSCILISLKLFLKAVGLKVHYLSLKYDSIHLCSARNASRLEEIYDEINGVRGDS